MLVNVFLFFVLGLLNVFQKIELFKELEEKSKVATLNGKKLTSAARNFMQTAVHPYLNCYRTHFQSQTIQFEKVFRLVGHSRFKTRCLKNCKNV